MRGWSRAVFAWVLCAVSSAALAQGQGTTTYTTTASSSVGSTNAKYDWITHSIGPTAITVGDLGRCTLAAGPLACTATGGSGTAADPFTFDCGTITTIAGVGPPPPLTISACTLPGLAFPVAAGDDNFDVHEHTVFAAQAATAAPIPVGPWAAWGSGLALAIAAMVTWRSRRRR